VIHDLVASISARTTSVIASVLAGPVIATVLAITSVLAGTVVATRSTSILVRTTVLGARSATAAVTASATSTFQHGRHIFMFIFTF